MIISKLKKAVIINSASAVPSGLIGSQSSAPCTPAEAIEDTTHGCYEFFLLRREAVGRWRKGAEREKRTTAKFMEQLREGAMQLW